MNAKLSSLLDNLQVVHPSVGKVLGVDGEHLGFFLV